MTTEKDLQNRSENKCELCGSTNSLRVFDVQPTNNNPDHSIYACQTCVEQIENPEKMDANHWRCLNDSMWSAYPAVQVMAWRMLNKLKAEGWPQDLLDTMYMDENTADWAKAGMDEDSSVNKIIHKDSNGVTLVAGDTVVLIKDLDVKGAGFTAKRGTAVRNIMLVQDNAEQIEGKVNGQQLVLLTKFVKKS